MNLIEYDAKKEYLYMIKEYLFPLLGLKEKNIVSVTLQKNDFEKNVFYQNKKIYFFPYKKSLHGYYVDYSLLDEKELDLSLCNNVNNELTKVSYNNFGGNTKKKSNYLTYNQCIANYKVAVQNAICEYVTGKKNSKNKVYDCNITFLSLIDKLEDWSSKTYEGKKIPFGFIIDLKNKSSNNVNYLDFLDEEFSATLSDGISSVIIIDDKGNYLGYNSIVENNIIDKCKLKNCLPIRFTQIINKNIYENSNKIGVFLLTGGDILIAKDGCIELIKRNGKWANFSFNSFKNTMKNYKNAEDIDIKLLEEVFSTAIDVSLSHCGGIIAIVKNGNELYSANEKESNIKKSILSECDNFLNNYDVSELEEILKENGDKKYSIDKKIFKRKIIKNLLNNKEKFYDLDRKLRSELVSLDGATIIQKDGKVVSFGAIIENEKGSSGGGRGAATRRLSDYGGLAIKISTDGYIEVYMDKELKYFIK